MRRIITQAGHEVWITDHPSEAQRRVEVDFPSAVVVGLRRAEDQNCPVVAELRRSDAGKAVPVLLVSDPGSAVSTPEAAMELGANRLVLRPIDETALVGALRELLGAGAEAAQRATPGAAQAVRQADDLGAQLPPSGDVRLIDLPHLLHLAYRSGLTGTVRFSRDQVSKESAFDSGYPVFAASNQPQDRLGELLYREGKITWEQYAECRQVLLDTGRRLGAVLVDKGVIKSRELFPLVRRHVGEIIYSLFSWTDGQYALTHGETSAAEKIRLDTHPTALVAEGIRRKYGMDRMLELLGPPETHLLTHQAGLERLARAELSEGERRVIELMDGERSLAEIGAAGFFEELTVYQAAYIAVVLGAAVVRGDGVFTLQGDPSVAAARRREEGIDRQRIAAKHAQVRESDYFVLLGLRPDASHYEVMRAYERCREEFRKEAFSPELASELASELEEIGEVLDEALLVLRDDQRRTVYRETLT